MAERTKTVVDHYFYYKDARSESPDGFMVNVFTFDEDAGDKLNREIDGSLTLAYTDGRSIEVPPFWLWLEKRPRKVVVQETA